MKTNSQASFCIYLTKLIFYLLFLTLLMLIILLILRNLTFKFYSLADKIPDFYSVAPPSVPHLYLGDFCGALRRNISVDTR